MKKLRVVATIIMLVMLTTVSSISAADAPVTATFIKPLNDLMLDVGYDVFLTVAVSPSTADIAQVTLYRNYEVDDVATEGTVGSETVDYQFHRANLTAGNYRYTAVVQMTDGTEVAVDGSRNIVVAPLIKKIAGEGAGLETFDRVVNGQPASFVIDSTTNADRNTAVVPDGFNYSLTRGGSDYLALTNSSSEDPIMHSPPRPDGVDHGKALVAHRSLRSGETDQSRIVYRGPGMGGGTGAISAGRHMAMEMDIYLGQTNQAILPLVFRRGSTTTTNQLEFVEFNRAGKFGATANKPLDGYPAEQVDYEANRWYKVRVEVDFSGKIYDVWLDDIHVVKQRTLQGMHSSFETTGVPAGCISVNITHQSNVVDTFYMDNMTMYDYELPPVASGVQFKQGNNITWSESYNAPVDASMVDVRFNNALDVYTLMGGVELFLVDSGQELKVPFTEDCGYQAPPPGMDPLPLFTARYGMILESNLRKNAQYRIKIKEGITDADGISSLAEQVLEFTTEKPDIYVQQAVFSEDNLAAMNGGTVTVRIVNNSGNEQKLKLVTAFYRENRMEQIEYKNVTVNTGLTTEDVTITLPTDTNGGRLALFLWNSLTDVGRYYTNIELE